MKALVLVAIALVAVQMTAVWLITVANRQFFEGRPAAEYPQAIKALSKERPLAALAIRGCYLACLLELFVLVVAKFA